ncbi:ADP-ribosyltransferase [Flavobacterium sp. U410]
MNQALNRLPNYETNTLLYRIENLTDAQIKEYYKVGEEVTNKHFTSSTYNYEALRDAVLNRPFTLIIRIKSKNGKLIENISTLKKEKEVLFKSNSIFILEKIGNTINPIDPDNFMNYVKEITLIEK